MTVSETQLDGAPSLAISSAPTDALQLGGDAHPLLDPFQPSEPPSGESKGAPSVAAGRPSFVFLGVVAALTLASDIGTKAWAEVAINRRGFEPIEIVDGYFSVILAYNRGGAWGLFHDASEFVRRPFFLCVSAAAILFIVSLYAKLLKSPRALTWGLPLVLGGALGNLSDRITRSQVIDFLDYRADWVLQTNAYVRKYVPGWTVTDHWPTFNVADVAICIGVGLMALDMMTTRRRHSNLPPRALEPSAGANEPGANAPGADEPLSPSQTSELDVSGPAAGSLEAFGDAPSSLSGVDEPPTSPASLPRSPSV
jgi:signal peptidase II